MANLPPEWHSWEIFVDIVGLILTQKSTELAFGLSETPYILIVGYFIVLITM